MAAIPSHHTTDVESTLLPNHLANLRSSGISDAVAKSRGYHSVTTPAQLHSAGFSQVQQSLVPALLIPVWNVHGKVVFHHIRPDSPRINAKGKSAKYEFPAKIKMDVDVPPLALARISDPSEALWITEGCKKADSAVSAGACCVSVIGTWNWRGTNVDGGKTALAAWESIALEDRLVYLAFDSDAMEKKEVYLALARFREFLKSRHAKVRVVYLPPGPDGSKTGLDDFLVRGGTLRDAIATAQTELLAPKPKMREPGEDEQIQQSQRLGLTDLGNARRFVKAHGKDVRYCKSFRSWFLWNGVKWAVDETDDVQRRMRSVVGAIYTEAAHAKTVDDREKIGEHAVRSESRRSLESAEIVSQAEEGVPVTISQFDQNEWLINTTSGTVDIRTGQVSKNNRSDMLTKVAGVAFDSEAKCPTWDRFLSRIMDGREDLVDFLRRAVGYSLSGSTREQALFFCYGGGANGKSTFIETLRHVLGDYACAAKFDTFVHNDNRGDAREDLAALRGARFVSAVEGPEGRSFDEVTIKQLTGGDTIRARSLFKDSFEFRPVCKIWLAANHKPSIKGEDDGIWRRMRLVPFDVSIPEHERDGNLVFRLKEEAAGILAWAVRGAVEWQTQGLGTPLVVTEATDEYREESDRLGEFLNECCHKVPGTNLKASELFSAYKEWSDRRKERPLNSTMFGRRMKERKGMLWTRDRDKAVWYEGLRLNCG